MLNFRLGLEKLIWKTTRILRISVRIKAKTHAQAALCHLTKNQIDLSLRLRATGGTYKHTIHRVLIL